MFELCTRAVRPATRHMRMEPPAPKPASATATAPKPTHWKGISHSTTHSTPQRPHHGHGHSTAQRSTSSQMQHAVLGHFGMGWAWMDMDGHGWTWVDMGGHGWTWVDMGEMGCGWGWMVCMGVHVWMGMAGPACFTTTHRGWSSGQCARSLPFSWVR